LLDAYDREMFAETKQELNALKNSKKIHKFHWFFSLKNLTEPNQNHQLYISAMAVTGVSLVDFLESCFLALSTETTVDESMTTSNSILLAQGT